MSTYISKVSSLVLLEEAFIQGSISSNEFLKALDTSNLVKKKIVDKNGKTTTKWVSKEEAEEIKDSKSEEAGDKTSKNKIEKEPKKLTEKQLSDFAKNTSDEDLLRHSKGTDEQMRIIAKKELENRKTEHEEKGEEVHTQKPIEKEKPKKQGKFDGLDIESVKNLKKFRGEVIKNNKKIAEIFGKEQGDIGYEDLIDLIGGFKPEFKKFEYELSIKKDSLMLQMECGDYYCERIIRKSKNRRGEDVITMRNELLKVKDTGKGLGLEIMDSQISKGKELGIQKMICQAAGHSGSNYNGYYTWARIGYRMNNDEDEQFLGDILRNESMDNMSLSELLLTEKGREFWKENGFPFEAEFDLDDKSTCMKIFNNYKKLKNGK